MVLNSFSLCFSENISILSSLPNVTFTGYNSRLQVLLLFRNMIQYLLCPTVAIKEVEVNLIFIPVLFICIFSLATCKISLFQTLCSFTMLYWMCILLISAFVSCVFQIFQLLLSSILFTSLLYIFSPTVHLDICRNLFILHS